LIARAIGAEGRGLTASATAALLIIAALASFGSPQFLRRESALDEIWRWRIATRMWTVSVSPIAIGCSLAAGWMITDGQATSVRILMIVLLASSIGSVVWMRNLNILLGVGRFRRVMALQIASPLTLVALTLTTPTDRIDTALVLGFMILGNLFTVALSVGRYYRPSERSEQGSVRELLDRSRGFGAYALVEIASNRSLILAGVPIVGASAIGLASAGLAIYTVLLVFGQTIANAYYADFAHRDSLSTRESALRQGVSVCLVTGAPAALLCPFAVPFAFGRDFDEAVGPAVILVMAVIPATVSAVCVAVKAAEGAPSAIVTAYVLNLVVQFSVLAITADLGANAFAVAYCFGYGVSAVFLVRSCRVSPLSLLPTPSGAVSGFNTLRGRKR
jgi:O-antigen/teichoic acid export membrane protein